jgi:1,4-dihydroxy-2-naphthoyl-CoA synthase
MLHSLPANRRQPTAAFWQGPKIRVRLNRAEKRGKTPRTGYVGYGAAQEILIEGRSLTASEARELWLINRVVPGDAVAEKGL